ncbi:MAG: SAM hydroxide adenosyltransferase [Acidimicrobiales bacterium]
MLPGLLPVSREEDGGLHAEILWADRFGNLQLNVDPDELEAFGDQVAVVADGSRRIARRIEAHGELRTGEIGLLVDSYGLSALVANRASAAVELHLDAGDAVRLEPLDEQESASQRSAGEVIVPFGRRNG